MNINPNYPMAGMVPVWAPPGTTPNGNGAGNGGCPPAFMRPYIPEQGRPLVYGGCLDAQRAPCMRVPLYFVQAIPAGTVLGIPVQVQRPFQPDRLIVPSSSAQFFRIGTIEFGTANLRAGAGGNRIDAIIFSEVATDVGLRAPPLGPNNTITIEVENVDPVNARTFRASFVGSAIYGWDA